MANKKKKATASATDQGDANADADANDALLNEQTPSSKARPSSPTLAPSAASSSSAPKKRSKTKPAAGLPANQTLYICRNK